MFTKEQELRFWKHVEIGAEDGCWNWQASRTRDGYGKVKIGGVVYSTHRVAFSLFNNSVELNGFEVMHLCDNPICCNPAHLVKGTHKENMQDMVKKGRQGKREKGTGYKLIEGDVCHIRLDFSAGMAKHAISRKYGISPRHVRAIVNGEYWTGAPRRLHAPKITLEKARKLVKADIARSEAKRQKGIAMLEAHRRDFGNSLLVLIKDQPEVERRPWYGVVLHPVRGKVQRTYFDLDGFSGHECFETYEEAAGDAYLCGFRRPDPYLLDRLALTERFEPTDRPYRVA